MCSIKLCEFGVDAGHTYGTWLKAKLLAAIPDLKEMTKGKQVLLAFDHAINEALSKTCTPDFDLWGVDSVTCSQHYTQRYTCKTEHIFWNLFTW